MPNNATSDQTESNLPQPEDFNFYNTSNQNEDDFQHDVFHYDNPKLEYFNQNDRQSKQGSSSGTCNYVQTCKQTVTGRRLQYSRALKIIQKEEYLNAVDTDIIRRNFDSPNYF